MMTHLGFLGCGKMGSSLIRGISHSKPELTIHVYDKNPEIMREICKSVDCTSLTQHNSVQSLVQSSEILILAVKPKDAIALLSEISEIQRNLLIVSIVAGLSQEKVRELSACKRCIRVMPNTPSLVSAGVIAIEDKRDDTAESQSDYSNVIELFSNVGTCYLIPSAGCMDVVTALSGSSPALFAILNEAMVDAAVAEGLPRKLAEDLCRETMLGTAKLLQTCHAMQLKADVMSPGGTTAAGIMALEENGFQRAAHAFIQAASEKSRSLL